MFVALLSFDENQNRIRDSQYMVICGIHDYTVTYLLFVSLIISSSLLTANLSVVKNDDDINSADIKRALSG